MKIRGHLISKLLVVPIALAVMTLPGTVPSLHAQKAGMDAPPITVKVTIKDREKGYEVEGTTVPGVLTKLVVRNEDTVTHGFVSTLFKGLPVKLEGGTEVVGKHLRSFHVDAGKTMTLEFRRPHLEDRETVHYVFWCDIHPEVKGEMLIVETTGEIGGG